VIKAVDVLSPLAASASWSSVPLSPGICTSATVTDKPPTFHFRDASTNFFDFSCLDYKSDDLLHYRSFSDAANAILVIVCN
jgi:hypothetical protein